MVTSPIGAIRIATAIAWRVAAVIGGVSFIANSGLKAIYFQSAPHVPIVDSGHTYLWVDHQRYYLTHIQYTILYILNVLVILLWPVIIVGGIFVMDRTLLSSKAKAEIKGSE